MKLRRRNRNAKNENDREYLINNNTEDNPSKVVLLKNNFRCLELIFDIFRYVDWYGNLQKVHGKPLKLVLKQL